MVRISKQAERRSTSPRRCRNPAIKAEKSESKASCCFKSPVNALSGEIAQQAFIPKIK